MSKIKYQVMNEFVRDGEQYQTILIGKVLFERRLSDGKLWRVA